MSTMTDLSRFAQLAQAAYAELTSFNDVFVTEALKDPRTGGFADTQAQDFVANYRVLAFQPNDAHGFSATIFQNKTNSGEIVLAIRGTEFPSVDVTEADAEIATFGAARDQIMSLYTWFQDLLSSGDPTLSPLLTNKVTVTGHSLGGHLALAFSRLFPDKVNGVYTYNAPGFKQTADVDSFFNQVAGHATSFPVTTVPITNVNAANGPELISGLHTLPGPPQLNVFVEDQGVIRLDAGNHSSLLLSDSLVLYDVFAKIDTNLDVPTIAGILEAASATRDRSFEAGLDALRKIFLGPSITPTPISSPLDESGTSAARNAYYMNLIELSNNPAVNGSSLVESLVGLSDSAVFSQARNSTPDGQAYRYALKELNPFVIRGADYTVHNTGGALDLYDTQTGQGTWTLNALSDRAELLAEKLKFTLADGTPSNRSETLFVDATTGFDNGRGATATQVVIFDATGNDLIGRSGDDHLYGGAGNDSIRGEGGRDYLEGNEGNDFALNGGAGDDIILGQQGNDQLYGEAGNDRLNGGLGTDRLEGGAGLDTYLYHAGQGQDTIADTDKIGAIIFDTQTLVGGIRREGTPAGTYTSPDGQFTYVQSGMNLIINNALTIENFDFQNGMLGIKLADAGNLVDNAGPVINYNNGQPTVRYDGDATDNTPTFTAAANHEAYGFGGNDILNFEGGSALYNHQVFGGDGHDELHGGAGQDRIYGEAGRDLMVGVEGDDVLDGGGDIDLLKGGLGQDVLYGGQGDDGLDGGSGDDVVFGQEGNDLLSGESIQLGATTTGDDYLDGGAGADWLMGMLGDDVLVGGIENDRLYGDQAPATAPNFELAYPGVVTPLPGLSFSSTTGGVDYLDGGAGDDYLQGDGGEDILLGGAGNDQLYGDDQNVGVVAEADDWLDGGEADDQLFGGGGADYLTGGAGVDLLVGDFANAPGFNDTLDGGLGNDELQGGAGDDVLLGGADNDLLAGQEGSDYLDGGAGVDEVQGGDGDDLLFGGTENDRLFGQAGADDLAGEAGDDQLFGGDGDDFLDGGAGGDRLEAGIGDDLLVGGAGDDLLFGQDGGDFLEGEDGTDQLQGGAGADVLLGGTGNDLLFGDDPNNLSATGDDLLEGGGGNDTLQGGGGRDTYTFNLGEGADTIVDGSGEGNRLVFGSGITSESLTLGLGGAGSLVVRVGNTADSVQIFNFNPTDLAGPHPIDTFEFADGTVLTYSQLAARGFQFTGTAGNDNVTGTVLNDRIAGGAGNDALSGFAGADTLLGEDGADSLQGGDGDDVLSGATGDDVLLGGDGADVLDGGAGFDVLDGQAGHDTYVFGPGSGQDFIDDSSVNELNTIRIAAGLSPDQVTVTGDRRDLFISLNGTDDLLILGDFFRDPARQGFQMQFADGTLWDAATLIDQARRITGTDGPDSLSGRDDSDDIIRGLGGDDTLSGEGGDDVLEGGTGDDLLFGGAGHDTYMFNLGDGQDTLVDTLDAGESNTVVFGAGITPESLSLEGGGGALLISVGTTGDALVVENFDPNDAATPRTIDRFQFADNTVLSFSDLTARGFDIAGTDGDDVLSGTNLIDRFAASAGNDEMKGGLGSDIYVFGRGSGQDRILDVKGTLDTIRMAPGIAPTDIVATRVGNDLELSLTGTTDRLTLQHFYLASTFQAEQVEFADGTIWDAAFLHAMTQSRITGSAGDDVLQGTAADDVMLGLEGNDRLGGLSGDDRLDGGAGADMHVGGTGNDTYIIDDAGDTVNELSGEGRDSVKSSIGFALPDHVENLTLTGTGAIDGTGNALRNVLTGNSASNVLTGWLGDDTYVVVAGDTVVEQEGEGTDTVVTAQSYALGGNVENLTLTGSAAIDGMGNELDNVLTGNSSVNVLAGGAGHDTYVVKGLEIVVEAPDQGIDTVKSARSYRLGAHVENLTLLDSDVTLIGNQLFPPSIDGTGNELANALIGNRGDNVLDGGAGDDVLSGGAGSDLLRGGLGQDTYLFGYGSESDRVEDANSGEVDVIQMAAGIRPDDVAVMTKDNPYDLVLRLAGTANELSISNFLLDPSYQNKEVRFADGTVWDAATLLANVERQPSAGSFFPGSPGNDTFVGTPGSDWFFSQDGDDRLVGGLGNDYMDGGRGNDILEGGPGDDLLSDSSGNNVFDGGPGTDQMFAGTGQDTFVFGRGYGRETIGFHSTGADSDMVQMTADVLPGDVTVTHSPEGVALNLADTHDRLSLYIEPGFLTDEQGQVVFADGTRWSVLTLWNSVRNEPITGTDLPDRLEKLESDRTGDVLVGFEGDDTYVTHSGSDVIVEADGQGWDTVESTASYTLPAHVENLTLLAAAGSGIGNALDNFLVGNEADNIIDGGEGHDTLIGGFDTELEVGGFLGTGSDILIGGLGDDTLIPIGGIIDIFGGVRQMHHLAPVTPDDVLIGGPGDDTYVLYNADETVVENLDEGTDTVRSSVTYTLPNHVENLMLVDSGVEEAPNGTGNELDNLIIGNTNANILSGDLGNDTLMGGSRYIGSTNEAFSDASFADEVVDTLIGGPGNDTYVLLGTSFPDNLPDTVVEFAGEGTDTVLTRTSYALVDNVENLTLVGDSTITGNGNALDNVLTGNSAANVLAGEAGNDTLRGGAGDDTYVFTLGDGTDTIADTAAPGEGNRIVFGEGIAQDDLTFTQNQNTLTIQVGAGGDAIQLANFDPSGTNGSLVVETLAFADGSQVNLAGLLGPTITEGDDVITTSAGDQVIDALGGNDLVDTGAGNDTITGGAGNDTLTGGVGNDTYVFNLGDGVDTITDTVLPGEGNALVFGPGLTPADLSLGLGSLLIRVGANGDAIHLSNFDSNNAYGPHAIETFRFADDTVLTYNQLIDRGFDLFGTAGDDAITGTNAMDRIVGLASNDVIQTGAGDDVLDGGTGADTLDGGAGDDTYVYHLGDGLDQIKDAAGLDTVSFGAGLTFDHTVVRLADVAGATVARLRLLDEHGNELSDQGLDIPLEATGASPIEQVTFADGTSFALSDLVIRTQVTEGTRKDDVIRTGRHDDVISAGKGDDTISAGSGHDTVYAGKGGDRVYGEAGDDALYGNKGKDVLDGGYGDDLLDGNKGNDTLRGGPGNDRLLGGKGKDTLEGGPGDDLLDSGEGHDTLLFGRGDGQDTLIGEESNRHDTVRFGTDITPRDLILSRQAEDLRVALYGSTDQFTIQDWYADRHNRTDAFVAGNGQQLLNTKVDQLIQAMASFSDQSGLAWEQAIAQRPQEVQHILAASWQ